MPTKNPSLSREEVWKMFDGISYRYDFINTILSMGMDRRWRKLLAKKIPRETPLSYLDVACGTGAQLFSALNTNPYIEQAIGIDLSTGMLQMAKQKARRHPQFSLISLLHGSGLSIPFKEGHFDVVSLVFGIRNFTDPQKGLKELHRVLQPGGRALILEFSLPSFKPLRQVYLLYLRHVLPVIGRILSCHPTAYSYLNKTIETFPHGKAFENWLLDAGFASVESSPLCGGIVTLYAAKKAE